MLESFYISQHPEIVDTQWRNKNLISFELFGQTAFRQMRPNLLGDRTRLDLMWYQSKLGLRGISDTTNTFPFFELPSIPDTAHPLLGEMIEKFKSLPPPSFLEMAQLRFRCHSSGLQGLWIDCSNILIKNLLEEKTWLSSLLKDLHWKIELGQKQKEVLIEEGHLKFCEATPCSWLDSYSCENTELPLVSYISSFSQPGPEANRALMAAGLELLDTLSPKISNFCEWGAGYGNLTACYASRFTQKNWASELEASSVHCLKLNQKYFLHTDLAQQKAGAGDFPVHPLWILDPPRSGFPELLSQLSNRDFKPRYILIYHCHHKGLLGDSKILKASGYQLTEWSSVDIFPATPHHEVISLWKIS